MRILGRLLALEDVGLSRPRSFAKAVHDPRTHILHRVLGQPGGIRAHVGDEAGGALIAQLDALVQALGQTHGALGREAQLARRLLLQARGDEGRGRILAALLALDRGDPQGCLREQSHDIAGLAFVGEHRLLAIQPHHPRSKRGRRAAFHLHRNGPVLLRTKGLDLSFAIHHQTHRHRLHPARRQAPPHLGPQDRANLIADQPVEHAPRLLRLEFVHV